MDGNTFSRIDETRLDYVCTVRFEISFGKFFADYGTPVLVAAFSKLTNSEVKEIKDYLQSRDLPGYLKGRFLIDFEKATPLKMQFYRKELALKKSDPKTSVGMLKALCRGLPNIMLLHRFSELRKHEAIKRGSHSEDATTPEQTASALGPSIAPQTATVLDSGGIQDTVGCRQPRTEQNAIDDLRDAIELLIGDVCDGKTSLFEAVSRVHGAARKAVEPDLLSKDDAKAIFAVVDDIEGIWTRKDPDSIRSLLTQLQRWQSNLTFESGVSRSIETPAETEADAPPAEADKCERSKALRQFIQRSPKLKNLEEENAIVRMIDVCLAKKDSSWAECKTKFGIDRETLKGWANRIGMMLKTGTFDNSPKVVEKILEKSAKKRAQKTR